jgi:hypothetical protein
MIGGSMNIQTLAEYVEQEVDDSFATIDVARWFNKGISQYNLIPPLTKYPYISIGQTATVDNGLYDETSEYPLDMTFMLGVMLPYISSSVKSSEAALSEKQLFLQEFMMNATTYKRSIDVPLTWMLNQKNEDLSNFEIGEGIFLSDFTRSPFAGEWQRPSLFSEIVAEEDDEE